MKSNIQFSLILLLFISIGSHSQSIVDYRAWQSPVKSQENRGTCTAFAVIAAMETFPGIPNDLSEQYIYAQVKSGNYNETPEYSQGTFLKFYTKKLVSDGTLREDQEPYNPDADIWDSNESNFDKMKKDIGGTRLFDILSIPSFAYKIKPEMYSYRNGIDAMDVEWVKSRLDAGVKCIPVSYGINGNYWFSHTGGEDAQLDPSDFIILYDTIREYSFDQAKRKYGTNDLLSLITDGVLLANYSDSLLEVNDGHAVAIVGYDANGFLIKNSWGTDKWGDKGYGWVSFDYHRFFALEVLSLNQAKVDVNEWAEPAEEDRDQNLFHLKSLPFEKFNLLTQTQSRGLSLSIVFYGEGKMSRLSRIEYKGYDIFGNLLGTWYGNTQGIFDGRETGYETYVSLEDESVFPNIYKLVASVNTTSGWSFQNTYYNLEPKNQEYINQQR